MGDYLKSRKLVMWTILVALAVLVAVVVISGQQLPMRYALYAAGIGAALDVLGLLVSALAHSRRVDKLQERLEDQDLEHPEDALWDAGDQTTEAYYQAFKRLGVERRRLLSEHSRQRSSERKYLSQWTRRVRSSISAIRLTLRNTGGQAPEALMEDLQSLEHYVDMVSFHSRMNARDGDFFIKETDPDPIVRRVAERFAAQAGRRKLKLKITPSPGKVYTDEKCLQFMLEQLISNALKFTNIGEITLYFEKPGLLCVRDTGTGMKPEVIEMILEDPNAPKTKKPAGRIGGIGLITCQRLAEQLGQTLSIVSTPGSGTIVKIAMEPVVPPEETQQFEPEEDVRVSRRRKKRRWGRKAAPEPVEKPKETKSEAETMAALAAAMVEVTPPEETPKATVQIPRITDEMLKEEAKAEATPAPEGPKDPEEAIEGLRETREAWEEAAEAVTAEKVEPGTPEGEPGDEGPEDPHDPEAITGGKTPEGVEINEPVIPYSEEFVVREGDNLVEPDQAQDFLDAEEREEALRELKSEIIRELGLEVDEDDIDDLTGPSLAKARDKE